MTKKKKEKKPSCKACRWSSRVETNGSYWCEFIEAYVTKDFVCESMVTDKNVALMKREEK